MSETIDPRYVAVEVLEPVTDRTRIRALGNLLMKAEARLGIEVSGLDRGVTVDKVLARLDGILRLARPGQFPASIYSRCWGLRALLAGEK